LASTNDGPSETRDKRRVEIDDLYRFRLLADPQVSPDGRRVAYVQTRLRKKKNDYASNIWIVPAEGGGEPVKFTQSDQRDMTPRWSPAGGEMAFVSTRSGKSQIWVIPLGGGEARQLTRTKRGVGEFAWSPDGRWIAFVAAVDNDLDKRLEAEARAKKSGGDEARGQAVDSENKEPGSVGSADLGPPTRAAGEWEEDPEDPDDPEDKGEHAKVFTRLHFKADGAGLLERRQHLFIVPSGGGEPRQLTEGMWDEESPRWSPDGRTLAFMANREPDADYVNVKDILTMPVDDRGQGGEIRRVTRHDSAIMAFDWLPGGDGFAAFAHKRIHEGGLATNPQVWTVSMAGETRSLTEGLDRPVGPWMSSDMRSGTGELRPRFSKDGSTIYFRVTTNGNVHVYSVPVAGGEVRQVTGGERQVLNFGVAEDGIVFAASSATNPNDLYRVDFDGSHERRLTAVNSDVLEGLALSEPREFRLPRPGGPEVHGWMLMPPGYQEGRKYPLVLQVHGGPHMSYGNVYFHEFQVMAARGYIVLYTNPRGSQGYGQTFADAILNDWGGVDYEDIMACLDHAIAQGSVDESRLGVAGGSYGGYMSSWIIGHTQRFKAAVASRVVSNIYSAWGSGDFTWMLFNWEFEGSPQERTALYLERSPMTYVREMHTPLLITHADDDQRTNIEQGEQLYTALKVLNRDVKMVRLPSGGHDTSRTGKPSLRVERMEEIVGWFEGKLLPRASLQD
jgi:dipeptidyl aminopeptidase/acylaminoacyl peptidase